MRSTSYSTSCSPLHATSRRPDSPTDGDRDRRIASALGLHLADWQAAALEVAGELDVDRHGVPTGRMRYPVVVWIVPRRAGKSLAALVRSLAKATSAPRSRCWYTPHRREVGAALWRDEWIPMVEGSRLEPLIHVRRSNGSETLTVRRLGSTVRLFAPDGQALRSQNADLVVVDEAREFDLVQGERLEAAVRPAQARRRGRQLWVVSSAGLDETTSPWLARWRDLGRGGADGVCYLEYAAPTDLAWDDPATWALGHPSVADGTVDVQTLAADAATMDPELFQTEYLGWWHTGSTRHLDLAAWVACAEPAAVMPSGRRWVSAEVAPDRSSASVCMAAADGGRVHVELILEGSGTTWVAAHLLELAAARGVRLRLAGDGPAGNLAVELAARLGDRLEVASTSDVARACSTIHDLATSGRLRHRNQHELSTAAAAAIARRYGETWLWDRARTPPMILAATLAADAAARPTVGRPSMGSG